ncbi:hypothetical protein HAX54_014618 [Datura stramonium]|uniref:Uncharacterized protein n=1 Tax=Datura stramonium TaxID=4076 RepID=A0ABS8TQF0_DATST|nr:hypothetical protein [Datura stramonium]
MSTPKISLLSKNSSFPSTEALKTTLELWVSVTVSFASVIISFNTHSTVILWNPAIRKIVIFPKPPPYDQHMFWLGFGFDPKNLDFEVVSMANLGHGWRNLVVQYPWSLLSYDPKSKDFKDLDIHGRSESFFLSKYVESLVLLDGSSGATADPSIAFESKESTEL